jgi:hypothetical protein
MYDANIGRDFPSLFSLDVSRTGADLAINISGVVSTSRGLVGDTVFAVLPNIKPIHTFIVTLAFQSVSPDNGPLFPF